MRGLPRSRPKAMPQSVPAPVTGWNTRDALDAMAPTDAVVLDNWIPSTGEVKLRNGYAEHATGVGAGNVDTLVEYHAGSTRKLLACGGGEIWDATSAGAASSIKSGFSVNNWQTANFSGRVFFVNGTDDPQDYDGTTMSATSWSGSGLTPSDLVGVNVFKNRLFFWKTNSQDFWYASIDAVSGPLTKFPLSRVSSFGGNLLAMATWTRDGGDGVDDYAVFIMTTGEVVVYQGDDPGSASAWALVGVYRIANPIDIRGIVKVGGEVIITTTEDYVPLSRALAGQESLSSKLSGAVTEASAQADSFGWQSVLYRDGNLLIFNVPNVTGGYDQHVVNTLTQAACRFKDIPARCWTVYDRALYFGSTDGKVYKYTGNDDNGASIVADGRPAWNSFNSPQTKRLAAIRPVMRSDGVVNFGLAVGFDFSTPLAPIPSTTETSGSLWDTAVWDVATWSAESVVTASWRVASGVGQSLGTRLRVAGKQDISWLRTDYRLEVGINL